MQQRIPCVLMRGGTSRGPIFLRDDLPADDKEVDRILIAAMGSPHPLQVDGIGGGHPLTSKVAIVGRSSAMDIDIDYLFVQVNVESASTDRKPNCGNMLSAVGPFAIEAGLVPATAPETGLRIRNVNTGTIVDVVVQTPEGHVTYEGAAHLDGVAGTAAPIRMSFADTAGAVTGSLLPAGAVRSEIDGIAMTLIDAAMPIMLLRGADFGLSGAETAEAIDADADLFTRIETLRRQAGRLMGMGDVAGQVVPKVALLSPPTRGGTLSAIYLTPDRCHKSLAVTGAVTIATAMFLPNSIAAEIAGDAIGDTVAIEHPSGAIEIGVDTDMDPASGMRRLRRTSLIRTARRLFEGNIIVDL